MLRRATLAASRGTKSRHTLMLFNFKNRLKVGFNCVSATNLSYICKMFRQADIAQCSCCKRFDADSALPKGSIIDNKQSYFLISHR